MLFQIERHVKQGHYDQALELLPLLEQIFHDERHVCKAVDNLKGSLLEGSDKSLDALNDVKGALLK